mmetsp:Transcript_28392/g.90847  ORF Transcript_28392/g.90847 Transcript_28392/m.90847 type:complete len:97 (+) Transcript_28392:923-1213(+)
MALLRGATARARVSDRQGFDCEATAYPIETLPATDLKNIYGINKTDETQAKVEEETREITQYGQEGGYQISEYKSEYDTGGGGGGYQISDYKSIYD